MKTLKEVKDRCRIDGDHWIWTGATSNGIPRLWAPDHTLGKMAAQMGRRAVWHIKTGAPIPAGCCVFVTCDEPDCLNPAHMDCKTNAQRGAEIAASGKLKGQVKRILANRAICRKRSVVTPELIAEVLASPETGKALADRAGVKRETISKIRRRRGMVSFQPVGSIFSGLLAANDSRRKAA